MIVSVQSKGFDALYDCCCIQDERYSLIRMRISYFPFRQEGLPSQNPALVASRSLKPLRSLKS